MDFVFLSETSCSHFNQRKSKYSEMHDSEERQRRRQVVTNIRVPNSVWKKRVCDTFVDLLIIPEGFSGKLVISFKDGGISYIEKTQTYK